MKTIDTNTEWIECNLPWSYNDYSTPISKYPDLDNQIRDLFGKTTNDFELEIFGNDILESNVYNSFRDIEDNISRELNSLNLSFEEEKIERLRRLEESNNPNVKMVVAFRKHKKQVDEWYDSQPEVIAALEANAKAYEEWKHINNQKSFSGKGLAISGTLIQVQVKDQVETHLIGSINELRGVCNDCAAFQSSDIVLRYKVIYSNE